MVNDLETMFGRKVDMLEKRLIPSLKPRIQQEIAATTKEIYSASA